MNSKNSSLFLLYLSITFVIVFLQQEFVLLPELSNIDIVGEDSKILLLDKFRKSRWISFVVSPIVLLLRLALVSLCLFIGGFYYHEYQPNKYNKWFEIVLKSQWVFIVYSLIFCFVNLFKEEVIDVTKFNNSISLLFLYNEKMGPWLKVPLSMINIFEISYWILMSLLIKKSFGGRFVKTFKFVMSTYGVGLLFYIALLMFIVLDKS